jgi:hypothetical protein
MKHILSDFRVGDCAPCSAQLNKYIFGFLNKESIQSTSQSSFFVYVVNRRDLKERWKKRFIILQNRAKALYKNKIC